MKVKSVGMPGFESIYYQGKPVSHDTTISVENVLLARNKFHVWYLRIRYKKLGLRVVTQKWLNINKIKGV